MTQSQRVLCKADGSFAQSVLYNVHDSPIHIQRVLCKVMTQSHTNDTIRGRWLSHKGYCVKQMVRSLNQSVLYNVRDSLNHIQRVLCKVITQSHTKDTIRGRWLNHKGYCVKQMVPSLNQSVLYNAHDSLNHIQWVLCKVMTQSHTKDTIRGNDSVTKDIM
jgi:very-short-patch-repair endonuclease